MSALPYAAEPITRARPEACCDATIALVQSLSATFRCPVCGESYLPDPATRPEPEAYPRRFDPPPAPRDRRVQLAVEPSLRGARFPSLEDRQTADARTTDTERTARLLDEVQADLRASSDGGRDPSTHGVASIDLTRDVVQTSQRWGAVDLVSAALVDGPGIDDTIDERTAGAPAERETLRWLRRRAGVTGDALRADAGLLKGLHLACGYELAEAEVRERFDTVPESLRLGAPIAGRRRIEAAMKRWWA